MFEELTIPRLIKRLKRSFGEFPDRRTGQNAQYEMEDAGMGAFSVFFTQSPSFLAYQQEMKRNKGRSNAGSLFEMQEVPSDIHIRSLLDPVAPDHVGPVFQAIFCQLDQAEVLKGMRSHGNMLLVAMDGTEYFSSKTT